MSSSDFVTRGQALVTSGQFQEAVKVCRLGLLGRPTTVEGRVVLGQALLALRRYDEVLAEMRVALELDSTSVVAQTLKGEALLRKGDSHAAIEVLAKLRAVAPGDRRVETLLAEAQQQRGRPRVSASHPAVGFVSADSEHTAGETKAYLNPEESSTTDDDDDMGDEDTGGNYTKPTSIAAPSAKGGRHAVGPRPGNRPRSTPPPDVLAIGDRSGTVEVDPEIDGVEIDDEFGDIAAPPSARGRRPIENQRGAVVPSRGLPAPKRTAMGAAQAPQPQGKKRQRVVQKEVSTVELDDEELIEVEEPSRPLKKAGGTAVRNAVKMPSGPIDAAPALARSNERAQAAQRPTAQAVAQVPPHLAQLIANQPHVMQMAPVPPAQPLPPPPYSPGVPNKSAIAAALPTQMAMPMPQPTHVPGNPAAVRPTIVAQVPMTPEQQASANVLDAMFDGMPSGGDPAWAGRMPMQHQAGQFVVDGPMGPGMMPGMDPAMMQGQPAVSMDQVSQSGGRPLKTGMRKARSRAQIVVWILVGAIMIGGGIFAGFKIRAMRLGKQIMAAREQAVQLAKADTWTGWLGARDRLVGIAQASPTAENKAALARTRALIAYEFGDGLDDAKATLVAIGDAAKSLDGELAAAYIALAQGNAKDAKIAADRALALSQEDPAALYVAGQAALMGGDTKAAIVSMKSAADKENRPSYVIGLARAQAENADVSDALATLERALTVSADHPGALIEKGHLLAESGRILPPGAGDNASVTLGTEIRRALEKVIAEGKKPAANQERGVAPAQVALAWLAIARIDFSRGDSQGARSAIEAAVGTGSDYSRFGETLVDTMYSTVLASTAVESAERVLQSLPTSRSARITLARALLSQDRAQDALDALSKLPNLEMFPRALAVRGEAKAALGDLEGAAADFDAALKKMPKLESAIVGRARIELAQNDVEAARARIEARWNAGPPTAALATTYAAILRRDPGGRDKAKAILEKVTLGAAGVETTKAQLELARIARDSGDMRTARKAYEDAVRSGSADAKLESGLLLIEDRDPKGGREQLDSLVKEAGDGASFTLLVEAARARMLMGDHAGADQLLGLADKHPNAVKWKVDRERARLTFRKGDYMGAGTSITSALEKCGDDVETFLVAAEIASSGATVASLVTRLEQLVPERLKKRAEAYIIAGKLALADEITDKELAAAEKAYDEARRILDVEKASPRRLAQIQLGSAVLQYHRQNDVAATNYLDVAITNDPSLFVAYVYYAEILKERKDYKGAFDRATTAVTYNPDHVDGWVTLGTLAHQLGKKKELDQAITRVGALAPTSEALRQLRSLR